MDSNQRSTFLPTVLVREKAFILDPEGMGPWLHRVVIGLSESANRECEYSDMGDCMCDCYTTCRSGSGGSVGISEQR